MEKLKMETKTLMKQFMENLKKKGIPYKEKQIKLRKHNSKKFCLKCGKIRDINMRNLDGFCSECLKNNIHTKLFTLNPKVKVKDIGNENKR